MTRALVLIAAALALPAGAAQRWPVYREFKDWLVACDNTGRCEARGLRADGEPQLRPVLHRDAGAGATPVIELHGLDAARMPAALDFAGRALPLDARHWEWKPAMPVDAGGGDGAVLRSRTPAAALAFVAAATRVDDVRVSGRSERGSLTGFNAAIRYLDDVQGRAGTVGALIAKGRADERAVPAPAPMPSLRAKPYAGPQPDARELARLLDRIPAGDAHDCDAELTLEPHAAALGADDALVFVPCFQGAYQSQFLVYRGPRRSSVPLSPLRLVLDPLRGQPQDAALMNPDYMATTGMLTSYAKGRSLFDCGETAQWVFDGREFALARFTMQGICGGTPPGDFPALWRANIVAGGAR